MTSMVHPCGCSEGLGLGAGVATVMVGRGVVGYGSSNILSNLLRTAGDSGCMMSPLRLS